ncbi:hypothetical protein [Paenibacillus sp. 481]|uniref:hypothetical protein n=1 Tax=Paenibacillus sp. 481 TaxID=2835869 RepID=UPI001E65961E|nr:hypothetical protein [Paenibacillus sp. 481]UHA75203.1 hypothetical protein KIK04_09355 [Paenibacillus sp. 481]
MKKWMLSLVCITLIWSIIPNIALSRAKDKIVSTSHLKPITKKGENKMESLPSQPKQRLLIYYGIPENVNGTEDIKQAAQLFAGYDVIVFGAGLEEPDSPHHLPTKSLLTELRKIAPRTSVYGYIDLGVTTNNFPMWLIAEKLDKWKRLGAKGVFYDDAGYDYDVSRQRLNSAVQLAHNLKMPTFMNAWNPDDILASAVDNEFNPRGEATKLGPNDMYLAESFLETTDITQPDNVSAFRPEFRTKIDKMLKYRRDIGIQLMAVSTMTYEYHSSAAIRRFFRMNEVAAGVFSLDGYGVAANEYSADDIDQNATEIFPYMSHYYRYYNRHAAYTAKYNNHDFARAGFRLHSLPNDHYYTYPR